MTRGEYRKMWRENGMRFGYPKCCIGEFCKEFISAHTEDQKAIAFKTNGFVPCRKHTQMIVDGTIKVDDLIQNRTDSMPFPLA